MSLFTRIQRALTPRRVTLLLVIACASALAGLAMMVWSILDPRPLPVVLAMSMGQGFGTLSFVIYLFVVVMDLRRSRVIGDEAADAKAIEEHGKS